NNAGPITLTGGSPTGGVYSGAGINSAGQLIPASLPPGDYTVRYQACNSTASARYTIIPRASRINIFPNPAPNGVLSISATPEMVGAYVRVLNTAGQKVMEWRLAGRLTNYQFKWAAGIYVFEFTKETIIERKLVLITR
ncbi:MAG TPA: T9SS type A sorting domain-containing protein, partial [Chitinophagaceae bacterium]|nr:T9SS type A sorting domain-containing protein [Chitinophagaceae bacterium]